MASIRKTSAIFPDDQHIASLNHETGSITFFHIDYEKGLLVGSANPVRVDEPKLLCYREGKRIIYGWIDMGDTAYDDDLG